MQVSTKRKQIEVLNVVEIKYLIPRFNRGTNRPWWKTDRCELTHEGLDVVEVVDKAIIAKQPEPYLQSRLGQWPLLETCARTIVISAYDLN